MKLTHLRQVWQLLILPYFKSEEKFKAISLLLSVLFLIGLFVFFSVRLNYWSNDFYTALQELNGSAFFRLLKIFCVYAFFAINTFMVQHYLMQLLELKWRQWLTQHFINAWTHNKAYYQLQLREKSGDNPDQRIAEDIASFTIHTVSLTLTLFQQILMLIVFLGVLWKLSGLLSFTIFEIKISIPGYLCWAAFLYAAAGSWISVKLGRPLIKLNYEQEKYEANFRYSLVRFRENVEGVAFYRGEEREKGIFHNRFWDVLANKYDIIKRMMGINWWNSFYGQINAILPTLLMAPRFFAKQITFGHLMQTMSAFSHVSHSLSFIVETYPGITSWIATSHRLIEFYNQTLPLSQQAALQLKCDTDHFLLHHVDIHLPNGQAILTGLELKFGPEEHTLITGPSGLGKSTFLRVLAGLWHYGAGEVHMPAAEHILFLPQKPYMPLGTLRETLTYPLVSFENTSAILNVLETMNLSHLKPYLEQAHDWSRVLSLGEQQRISFARALLKKPRWLLMDEATSALDEENERRVYLLLRQELAGTTFISVGHRSSLKALHTREISLTPFATQEKIITKREVA